MSVWFLVFKRIVKTTARQGFLTLIYKLNHSVLSHYLALSAQGLHGMDKNHSEILLTHIAI